ncbi:MAG: hypothetical protein LBE78_09170 [Burkholderiaceae bacterium]|jgi:hypothetical protein|nr:hypothetical protein [Burkholderiaceae bacterium]
MPLVTTSRSALLVFVSTVLMALCACSPPDRAANMTPIPAPPEAISFSGEASFTAATLTLADLRERLQSHYRGQWKVWRYSLPKSVGWPALQSHYQNALGTAWERDDRYREDAGLGYRSAVWRNGKKAVAIALLPAREPDAHNVLTVFEPESER